MVTPDEILMQSQWLPAPNRPPEVAAMVVWFKSYRVGPYIPAKITENRSHRVDPYIPVKIMENRARPRNGPDWAVFGSDVATESPDGILRQGQWIPTSNLPPEVVAIVVLQKESRIDPICKKTAGTVRKFDPTWQSGYFFIMG
ncbi:hypothetical protein CRG98_009554 [Punica granatum]|uniref:Uncharacterized protein n=1 Tax=Punica granatum TaxID=22663 RepID=A0A2I0KNM9_PUNGR|nr:hypothetical protein CRG98_009554 [Punica granatum]